jgi:outer membrane protein assembly factor BamB
MPLTAGVVGWNNDGSANFPTAKPPVEFDGAIGKNIRWKAKLPNWSNSSPIVVDTEKGPRVLLLAEPLDYRPLLLCLDAETGKELWRRELDPVPLLPEVEQAAARELALKSWEKLRARKRVSVEIGLLIEKHNDAVPKSGPIPDALQGEFAPLLKRAEELGLIYKGVGRGFNGEATPSWQDKVTELDRDTMRKLDDWQLLWSSWEKTHGVWEGVAYPTPVSDGRRVYTVTAHNLYSCHDLDGKLVWQRRFPRPRRTDLSEADQARVSKHWTIHWGGGYFNTSPLLWQGAGAPKEGLLLSNAGAFMRALDAGTGAVVWESALNGSIGQAMGVPNIVTIGETPCMIAIGNEYKDTEDNDIVRIADGKILGVLPGRVTSKSAAHGSVVVLADGTVVNLGVASGTLVGWSLALGADGRVTPTQRWQKERPGAFLDRPCWRDRTIYRGGIELGGTAGMKVGSDMRGPSLKAGGYDGATLLAGPYYIECVFGAGGFVFWDARTHAWCGLGTLPVNPEDGVPAEVRYGNAWRATWRWLGAATPFAYKDRLYIRAYDFLWCIASDLDAEAAMKQVRSADDAGRLKMANEDPSLERRAAALQALGLGPAQPGGKVLRDQIAAVAMQGSWEHRNHADTPFGEARRRLGMLLRALGAEAEPTALSILKDGEQKPRETVAAAILWGDLPRRDGFRDALISLLIERKISDELGASVLAVWPNDPAVTTTFAKLLNDGQFRKAQPTLFGYLLPQQATDQAPGFLADVAAKTPHDNVRGSAIAELVERKAFEALGKLIASATGRQQGALFWPLCHAAKTPEAKAFTVALVKKKLEAGANPAELGINALPALGADAASLLPLLKAIKTEDANFQKQIADIVAQIETKTAAEQKK